MTTTVPAVLARPPEGWLFDRRAAAAGALAGASLPTAEEEVWRYSPIGELDLNGYTPSADGSAAASDRAGVDRIVRAYPAGTPVLVTHNGRLAAADAAGTRGVYAGSLAGHPRGESLLQSAGDPVDVFAALNLVMATDPVAVIVDPGVELDGPVVVVHVVDGDHSVSCPRSVFVAGANSRVSIAEHVISPDRDRLLVAPVVELIAERDARLRYLNVQQLGSASWQIANHAARVDSGASLVASTAAFGGHYARHRTDCRLVGRGAHGVLQALYFGRDEQTLDFRTFQDHVDRDTTSNLLFKGAVDDRARAVYTGMIHVFPGARGTNAFQTNRNLKLSDHAWAESVPNLMIENNDVTCSHASAIGPVDEDQLFYLESRGVPTARAERLIVTGFFDEVLRALPVPEAGPLVAAALSAKIEGHG